MSSVCELVDAYVDDFHLNLDLCDTHTWLNRSASSGLRQCFSTRGQRPQAGAWGSVCFEVVKNVNYVAPNRN
jgi:hypothetical protein